MLTACPVPGKKKSAELVAAFIAGAPKTATGRVFYGVTEGNLKEWQAALRGTEPWFYCDNSYFDCVRGLQYRVTKNRIQHDGEGDTDSLRFNRLHIPIAPPRDPDDGDYVLCVPQSDAYMRLVIDYRGDWIEDRKPLLERHQLFERQSPRRPLTFRTRAWSSDKLAIQRTLPQDLARARIVLTHSSAAAVSAVLGGIAVLVSAYSCAFRQATIHDEAERRRWAGVLADHQFDLSELRSGLAWKALNP
jgi:hypothetical protein